MRIYLYQPQIPQNTGNIARTCAALGCSLRLIPPLGFALNASTLKRAGLDYWKHVDWQIADQKELENLINTKENVWLFSSKARCPYQRAKFSEKDALVFGNETSGLPADWLELYKERALMIPQRPGIRCLNLATAAGIGLYEAHRQLDFTSLSNGI